MKKILITGGAGFIGTNLIPQLKNKGCEIHVLDNEVLGKKENIPVEVNFHSGDIRDADLVHSLVKEVDVVVHLAADTRVIDSIENPRFNFENNVLGFFNIIEGIRKYGVDKLVNASTGGAIIGEREPPINEDMFPAPTSPYGASKLFMEGYSSAYNASYGVSCTSLRFANVYGPLSYHKGSVVAHFIKNIIKGKPLTVYGDGTQLRDYIYVKDLCAGIESAIFSENSGTFQLGTGIPTSINDLIATLKRVVEKDVEVIYKDFRAGEIKDTYCDISKAKKGIGFNPQTTVEEGIKETWNWFKENENIIR